MSTIKQKIAFKKVVNGSPLNKAMREVGYAKSTSLRTNKLTRTKGWEELMEQHLPDKLLAKKHKEGLDSTKKEPQIIGRDSKGAPVYEYVSEVDYSTRHKYLDSAYKLKRRFAETNIQNNQINVVFLPMELMNKHNVSPDTSTSVTIPNSQVNK